MMKGASELIVVVVLFMMAVSAVLMGYVFFSQQLTDFLESTEETLETETKSPLAEITILGINNDGPNPIVYAKNMGRVNVSGFTAYVNDLQVDSTPALNTIMPGQTVGITLNIAPISQGDAVKVSTGQGAIAIEGFGISFTTTTTVAPPPPGLVGFWKFDENVGTTAGDTSTYNNDGSLYSGTVVCSNPPTAGCPTWVPGVENSAIQFDGSNDHIRVPSDVSLDISDEITIAAWARPNAVAWTRLVSKQYQTDGTTPNSCYQLGVRPGPPDRWRWSVGGVFDRSNSTAPPVELGEWSHVVGTYDGTNVIIYLNGQPLYTGTASGSIRVNASEPFTIANSIFNDGRSGHFNGAIDEVKIWNRALSAVEVENEYQQYIPSTFIDANFESSEEGFTYQDDFYQGTANPTRESGQREADANCAAGQCLAVNLNLEDVCIACGDYSGGWENSFTVMAPTAVGVSFDYTLRLDENTEATENARLYYRDVESGSVIEGDRVVGDGNSPPDIFSSGTIYSSTGILSSGAYSFDAGCYLTQISFDDENAECWIDNVLIQPISSFSQWGATSNTFNTGTGAQNRMRCMGGTAPGFSNMVIDSLHMNFSVGGSAAMAVYFGGAEGNPTGATKQAELIGQTAVVGWNTFDLEPNVAWPAGQVTWVCWKISGATATYYSNSNAEAGDFFTTHGRHNETTSNLNPSLSFVNTLNSQLANYWYPAYLTYYRE